MNAEHDHLSFGDDLSGCRARPFVVERPFVTPASGAKPLRRGLLRYETPLRGSVCVWWFRLRSATPHKSVSWSRPGKETAIAIMEGVGWTKKRHVHPAPPSTLFFSQTKPLPQRQLPFFYSSPIPDPPPRTNHVPPRRPLSTSRARRAFRISVAPGRTRALRPRENGGDKGSPHDNWSELANKERSGLAARAP